MNPTPHDADRRDEDDDALQGRAELPPDPSEDALSAKERAEIAAYRALYAALRADEPDFALPARFAEDLARRVFPPREPFWDWLAPGVLLVAGIQALSAFPAALEAVGSALLDTLPAIDPATLSLLATAGLVLAALLLADRLLGPSLDAPAQSAATR